MKKIIVSALTTLLSASLLIGIVSLSTSSVVEELVDCPESVTIDPTNVFDAQSGFYLVQASDVITEVTENQICLIRAIDFDMGPIVSDMDTLMDGGQIIYPFANSCVMTDDMVVVESDSSGNTTSIDTVQFVVCEQTIAICEAELGQIDLVVLEQNSDNVIIDMCRVSLMLGQAADTMMVDSMMTVDTMMMDTMMVDPGGGNGTVFGTGAMPCSLGNNQISLRATFEDDVQTSGVETTLLDDVIIVNIGGNPEIVSINEIWDINISHQEVNFIWNPTGSVDPRTIRPNQFYRFYFDFGTAINQIENVQVDNALEGNPTVILLSDNIVLIQWGPGTSIGPTFDARVFLDLETCDRIEEDRPDDMMNGGGVDTMVVTPPVSDQVDTSVDCDNLTGFSFELSELSDSSFNVTETFVETDTAPILGFAFDGVESTSETVLVIDSMIRLDSTFVVDSIAVTQTRIVIDTTLALDSTSLGTQQVIIMDTTFIRDTTFVMDTLNFTVDSNFIVDSLLVVDQTILSIDSMIIMDTIVTIDSIFMTETIVTYDTMTVFQDEIEFDTIITNIDSMIVDNVTVFDTMFMIDSMLVVVDSMTSIDSTVMEMMVFQTIDTTSVINTTTQIDTMFSLDSMFVDNTMTVFDTIYNINTTFTVDEQVVIDELFIFQVVYDVDTTFTFDTMTVVEDVMIPDSVLVFQNILTAIDTGTVISTRTRIDSLFDIDTVTMIGDIQVIDSILQFDTIFSIDSMIVMETVLTFDTTLTIFDTTFNSDGSIDMLTPIAFAIDTTEMMQDVVVFDTMSMLDSMFVMTINTVADTSFTFIRTLIGVDSMMVMDTLLVIDSTFTQQSILRENGMFLIESILTVDSSLVDLVDYNVVNGDTICGSLVMGQIEGLNQLSYTLSWNIGEYELISCRSGDVPLFDCESTMSDPLTGTISASQDSISVTLLQDTELAEYCFEVLDDSIDSPNAVQIEQAYNNARTLVERELLSVNSGISLSDFGVQETEVLSNDGLTSFVVNRCIVYGTNFDLGGVTTDGLTMGYRFLAGCAPDGINSENIEYQICGSTIQTCCDDLGTKDVVLISFTNEGIINQCRFPVTVSDNLRSCNPIATFDCVDETTVTTDDITNNGDGTFTIGLETFGLGGSADHCIIKSIDYDAGPIRLSTGDLVVIDGRIAYNAIGCTTDDRFIEEIRDQDGNLVEQRQFDYVLCDNSLDFCCEDFDNLELTIVTQPINGTVITQTCPINVNIQDASLSISCMPIQVSCIDDINDESLRPDVLSSGLCSISADLLFIDDQSALDTCGIGVMNRTWFIDDNGDGQLSAVEVSCEQAITVVATESFSPISIRWPISRRSNAIASGLVLTCSDSTNFTSAVSDSIDIRGPLFCSSDDEFGIPTWCDPACQLIGYSSEITTIASQTDACAEIRVTHTVIDWCTYISLGQPEDAEVDIDPSNFEVISDLRDGCQDCGADGPQTYLRYRADALNVDGIYRYLQILQIEDDARPIIDAPETIFVSTSRTVDNFGNILACEGRDSFTVSASDVCGMAELSGELTWDIRVRNWLALPVADENGQSSYNFTGNSATIDTRFGDEGFTYFVSIDVRDACGNRASHTTTIEFEDIDPPVAACQTESANIVVRDSMVNTIQASDFDLGSSDNCTIDNSLRFSIVRAGEEPISPRAVNFGTQQSIDITCNNYESYTSMDVWVWDLNFNGTFCSVNLNYDAQCGDVVIDTTASIIAGSVRTPVGDGLSDVQITLSTSAGNDANFPKVIRTDDNGAYSLVNNPRSQDYQLSASLNNNVLQGVSTLDLVLIQQHILGIEVFEDTFKVLAADADASSSVSVSDIIVFRNVIVGIETSFPNSNSWLVIPADQTFIDPLSPWPFMTEINITDLEDDLSDQDFIAIKIGDVNYSADVSGLATAEVREGESLTIVAEDRYVEEGELVRVSLTIPDANDLLGFQFDLDHPGLTAESIQSALPWHISNARMAADHTVFSWNDKTAVSGSEATIEMVFKATQAGQLSDMISLHQEGLSAEAYQGEDLSIHDLDLRFTQAVDQFVVGQNLPNPFTSTTTIQLDVPQSGLVSVSIFDVSGKRVYDKEETLSKGQHQWKLHADELQGDGLMYYHVRYGQTVEMRKMILLK